MSYIDRDIFNTKIIWKYILSLLVQLVSGQPSQLPLISCYGVGKVNFMMLHLKSVQI